MNIIISILSLKDRGSENQTSYKDGKKMLSNFNKKLCFPYPITLGGGIWIGKRCGQKGKVYLQSGVLISSSLPWPKECPLGDFTQILVPLFSKKPYNQQRPNRVGRSWKQRDMVPCTVPGLQGTLDSYWSRHWGGNYLHSLAGPVHAEASDGWDALIKPAQTGAPNS